MALGAQGEILASEGNDLNVHVLAHHPGHTVGVQTGAVNQVLGMDRTTGGFQHQFVAGAEYSTHRRVGENIAPSLLELHGVGRGDLAIVDDAGGGRPQCLYPGHVGLQLFQPFRADNLQALHSIGDPPLVEGLQAGHFRLVGSHDHFAALIVLDLVFIAELAQRFGAAHAKLRFL